MADNSEEFDFAAASKAEIDKAKEDQKKQKQTSFEEEVDAYLVEKYPLEYFEDASGKSQRQNKSSHEDERENILRQIPNCKRLTTTFKEFIPKVVITSCRNE